MKEINVIVAMTKSRVIGKDGTLPWHLSEDLKLFKAHTTGNIVIMGRKTFDSIGRPLPNRRNIVVSKSIKDSEKVAGVDYYPDLEHAIAAAQEGDGRIFIIGGASIYHKMIEKADRLYISLVDGEYEGDTYFPEIKDELWKVVATEPHTGFTLKIYERK
jgi:dihydrofolate reductase